MKIISISLLFTLPLALFATEVKRGDSVEVVRAALGAPRGKLDVGARALLYFDRGEIEMVGGVVTRVALRSVADQEALEIRRTTEAVRVREEQDIRRAHLIAEGDALKARKLGDPSFQAAPLDYQVAFWEDFSRRYVDVPSAELLSAARAGLARKVAEGRERAEQAQRLAELETRVAQAEAQAREAQDSAMRARNYDSYYGRTRDYYGHYNHHSRPAGPVALPVYRLYEYPLPYATSPGMPALQPKYRNDGTSAYPYGAEANSSLGQPVPLTHCDDDRQKRSYLTTIAKSGAISRRSCAGIDQAPPRFVLAAWDNAIRSTLSRSVRGLQLA